MLSAFGASFRRVCREETNRGLKTAVPTYEGGLVLSDGISGGVVHYGMVVNFEFEG